MTATTVPPFGNLITIHQPPKSRWAMYGGRAPYVATADPSTEAERAEALALNLHYVILAAIGETPAEALTRLLEVIVDWDGPEEAPLHQLRRWLVGKSIASSVAAILAVVPVEEPV